MCSSQSVDVEALGCTCDAMFKTGLRSRARYGKGCSREGMML